jgi:hypothetical protein
LSLARVQVRAANDSARVVITFPGPDPDQTLSGSDPNRLHA